VKGPGSYKKGGVYVPPDKEEDMLEVNPELTKSMKLPDDFNASVCLVCGQCQAICPLEIDVNPRLLFRYVLFGLKDKVSSLVCCAACARQVAVREYTLPRTSERCAPISTEIFMDLQRS